MLQNLGCIKPKGTQSDMENQFGKCENDFHMQLRLFRMSPKPTNDGKCKLYFLKWFKKKMGRQKSGLPECVQKLS